MALSGISLEGAIIGMATDSAHERIQNQVTGAVFKELLDQQKVMGEQLVEMINNTTLDGTGQLVNRAA